MKTDDLIDRLAAAPSAAPLQDRRVMALAALTIAVAVALFLAIAGPRPGLGAALSQPLVLAKTLLPLLAFALALPELPRLARPEGAGETRFWRLALPGLVAAGLLIATLFDPGKLAAGLNPSLFDVVECLGLICLLSLAPLWAGLTLLRGGAVTRPGLAGGLAGFVAGSGVAAGYSLFCTRDNPLFYLVWYTLAIGLVTLAGWALGRRALTW